jgi:DNA-binding beta-propeller fold protein YncE
MEKMSDQRRFVALGDRRYAVVRPFAKFPPGMTPGKMTGGAVDSKGNLHICQRTNPPIVVFDRNGEFVRSYGEGMIADSHGISITPDDRVLVVDRDRHQVVAFDLEGRVLFTLGERDKPREGAPFSHPTDAAVGPNGDIYVTDGYGNTRIHQFSADGKLKRSWGEPGDGPGQFSTPHAIAVLKDGRVLACDRENDRIQIFDPDGKYLTEWKHFVNPMDVYADGRGMVYIGDQLPSVHARREDGTIVGRCAPAIQPHGIAGDGNGTLYVVDSYSPHVIQLLPA